MDKLIDLINQGGTGEYDARQERGEAVAWMCTRRLDGDKGELLSPFVATNRAYVEAHKGHDWVPLYAHPTPDAGRVAELEAECKRLREEVHAHASNEVDFAEQNAALESQLAETKKAYRSMVDANRAASERLAESQEREGRMREALDDLIGAVRHLNPCPATLEKAMAALAADKEGE